MTTRADFKSYLRWDLDPAGLETLTRELLREGTSRCDEIAKIQEGEHNFANTVLVFAHMESELDTRSTSVTFPR
jgi:hypothetical protein